MPGMQRRRREKERFPSVGVPMISFYCDIEVLHISRSNRNAATDLKGGGRDCVVVLEMAWVSWPLFKVLDLVSDLEAFLLGLVSPQTGRTREFESRRVKIEPTL